LIEELKYCFSRLKKIIADGGYRGEIAEKIKHAFGWTLEVILRIDSNNGFQVLPKRWIVERTFAWFESYRRLAKDYEFNTDTSETMIQLAMIKIMLNRIK